MFKSPYLYGWIVNNIISVHVEIIIIIVIILPRLNVSPMQCFLITAGHHPARHPHFTPSYLSPIRPVHQVPEIDSLWLKKLNAIRKTMNNAM